MEVDWVQFPLEAMKYLVFDFVNFGKTDKVFDYSGNWGMECLNPRFFPSLLPIKKYYISGHICVKHGVDCT